MVETANFMLYVFCYKEKKKKALETEVLWKYKMLIQGIKARIPGLES